MCGYSNRQETADLKSEQCGFESHHPYHKIVDYIMKTDDTLKEYVSFVLNEVSDEKITNLFEEMGIKIDLNKPWDNEDA